MTALPWLDPMDHEQPFPHPERALLEPDGLLAVGGSLAPQRLLRAYRNGIFPWYSPGQPILWWSPDPRMVLLPDQVRVSRSLRKTLRKGHFDVSLDRAFAEVIDACSGPRRGESGTWLTTDMKHAYGAMHELGHAHSVEVWLDDQLVGGLYGVGLGRAFFGESMFSRVSDASKVALVHLCEQLLARGFALIDCQMYTDHLARLGAEPIARRVFLECLERLCDGGEPPGRWQIDEPRVCDERLTGASSEA